VRKLFDTPIEITNRLGELTTSREQLLAVAEAMALAKAECTDNDPFGSRGWRGYQMGSRRLRETHVGIKVAVGEWVKDDKDQVPSIVNEKAGVRIVVCNTDVGTALKDKLPQNNSKKGAANERAIDANQFSFMEELDKSVTPIKASEKIPSIITYYLCCFADGEELRAELSCPVSYENGFFDDFVERIFLTGGDTGTFEPTKLPKPGEDGDGSDYQIPVTRKK
jgi:hypothetical protein